MLNGVGDELSYKNNKADLIRILEKEEKSMEDSNVNFSAKKYFLGSFKNFERSANFILWNLSSTFPRI